MLALTINGFYFATRVQFFQLLSKKGTSAKKMAKNMSIENKLAWDHATLALESHRKSLGRLVVHNQANTLYPEELHLLKDLA